MKHLSFINCVCSSWVKLAMGLKDFVIFGMRCTIDDRILREIVNIFTVQHQFFESSGNLTQFCQLNELITHKEQQVPKANGPKHPENKNSFHFPQRPSQVTFSREKEKKRPKKNERKHFATDNLLTSGMRQCDINERGCNLKITQNNFTQKKFTTRT